MAIKPWVNIGTVPNDGTGDQPRVAFAKLSNVNSQTYVANSAQFGGTTAVQIIQNTINQAVTDGVPRVIVPTQDNTVSPPVTLLPYNASLVTFNTAVLMIREGGSPAVYEVEAYGADAFGLTDETTRIGAALTHASIASSGLCSTRQRCR